MQTITSNDLLKEFQTASEAAHPCVLLVDVDSTLLHVHQRNEAIFRAFLTETPEGVEAARRTPAMTTLTFTPEDWGWKEPLERQALQLPEAAAQKMEAFWIQHFFSGRFLHKDYEFAGAKAFLTKVLTETSFEIIYLTARDEVRMGEATRQDFQRRAFPEGPRARLWLKPTAEIPDATFKAEVCRELTQKSYRFVYLIDNEPTVLGAAQEYLSAETLIHMDSVHSRKRTPDPQWRRLTGWS